MFNKLTSAPIKLGGLNRLTFCFSLYFASLRALPHITSRGLMTTIPQTPQTEEIERTQTLPRRSPRLGQLTLSQDEGSPGAKKRKLAPMGTRASSPASPVETNDQPSAAPKSTPLKQLSTMSQEAFEPRFGRHSVLAKARKRFAGAHVSMAGGVENAPSNSFQLGGERGHEVSKVSVRMR
eukprot:GHVN01078060.1.p1 GENE.GHVN01078060.1~~GHVN01078060.1.p1  ORF type:complete len:180 (-),score=24.78 GHVN01078060.1:708-1247(-)